MTTKTRHLYPTQDFPSLLAKMGRKPSDGVPLRAVSELVNDAWARIPTESERNTALMFGVEYLRITYTDELTPAEEAADELVALRAGAERIRALLPATGPMSAEQVAALRAALNGATVPVGPAPVGTLTDDQRRDAFFAWTRVAGFKLATQPRELRDGAAAMGFSTADVERWLKEKPGTIERLIAAL